MAIVITHPEMGIYLGGFFGMGFWSKLDPVGQDAAVTFESEEQAFSCMRGWEAPIPGSVAFAAVTPDQGIYASADACAAAGLERWSSEDVSMARPTDRG